jgi:hypothetical protein
MPGNGGGTDAQRKQGKEAQFHTVWVREALGHGVLRTYLNNMRTSGRED